MDDLKIHIATPYDAETIVRMIKELAKYEHMSEAAEPSSENLAKHLREGASPRVYCILAELKGCPIGYALYYFRYSTFLTSWYMHLEDVYVRESMRGLGVGRRFFQELAQIALDEGCSRLDLEVLTWNDPAVNAYLKMGARRMDDWTGMRFDLPTLQQLAKPSH